MNKMATKSILQIVLSSPGDVADERNAMERVIAELNRGIAADRQLHLELRRWETEAFPDAHAQGPQGVIDAVLEIERCDILLGIFWKRFGTPTPKALSGTEHEIRAALQSFQATGRPRLMLYFKEAERLLKSAEEHEQYARVLRFREEYSRQGLYWTFQDTPDFERLARQHLTQQIRQHFSVAAEAQSLPPQQRKQDLLRRYCQNLQQKFSTIHLFGEKSRANSAGSRMADMAQGFVALHLQDWRDDDGPAAPRDIDSLFFDDQLGRQFLLRGLPGSGKTTLLRYLAHRFAASGANGKSPCLPIYVRCKALDLSTATLEQCVRDQINQDSDSKEMFETLCAPENFLEKHTVLLCDGFDEIEHDETAKKFAPALCKLARQYPRCKIIVASRPIGLRPADWPGFHRFEVLPLTPEMRQDYLKKWFAETPD